MPKYAPKRTYRRRSTNSKRAPRVTVRMPAKKVAVARKSRVDKMARQIASLQSAKFGSDQTSRQECRSLVGHTNLLRFNGLMPLCWCNESICETNIIYQAQANPITSLYSTVSISTWQEQPFPLTTMNSANSIFDFQLYRQSKNQGVEATYKMKGVSYDIQVFAKAFHGYVQMYEITSLATVPRIVDQERQLPYCLPGFVNMCHGCDDRYSTATSQPLFKKKLLKTWYFNTIVLPAGRVELHTNPLKATKVYRSKNKVIRGTDVHGTNSVFPQDIVTNKKSWILFTTSTQDDSDDNHVQIQVQRQVFWADAVGEK